MTRVTNINMKPLVYFILLFTCWQYCKFIFIFFLLFIFKQLKYRSVNVYVYMYWFFNRLFQHIKLFELFFELAS